VASDLREQIKTRFDAEGIRFAAASLDVTLHQTESVTEGPAA
jgi:hypothetical protein